MSDLTRKLLKWRSLAMAAVGAIVLADLVLLLFLWQLNASDPAALMRQRADLETRAKLLKADVLRGQQIRKNLPGIGGQADHFYTDQLAPAAQGYSSIVGDLGEIAGKAGLRTAGTSFRDKRLEGRGVTEVDIDEIVEGDYGSVLHFIEGLERSKNFYLLTDLGLEPQTVGGLRLRLELRTYFRS
jgi:hypothetical protein